MSRAVEARWAEEIARGTRWGSTTEGEGSTRLGESVGNPSGHPGMQSLPMGAAMKRKSPRVWKRWLQRRRLHDQLQPSVRFPGLVRT